LRNADRDNAIRQRRPQKATALQPLREQTRALAVMPDDLDQVAAATPKNVEITSVRVPLQTLLNQTRKTREATAHIGMAGRKPHPYIARYRNHRRSSTSRTRASASGSTCASTRMRPRLPRSISINPIRAVATDRIRPSSAGKSFEVSSTASAAAICTGATSPDDLKAGLKVTRFLHRSFLRFIDVGKKTSAHVFEDLPASGRGGGVLDNAAGSPPALERIACPR
jgi:hypothetical protein